jgi:hypothetical protein
MTLTNEPPTIDRPSLLAVFNVIIALAGDIGVGLALFLTQAFIRSGLKTLLGHGPETEKVRTCPTLVSSSPPPASPAHRSFNKR